MADLKSWILACRLRTLPLSVSGAFVGGSYAFYHGFFDAVVFVLILLTTLSFQILSNLANDYGDGVKGTDNDLRIGPERAIQSGQISPKQMRTALVINVIISLLLSISLVWISLGQKSILLSLLFLLLGGLSIYAAITYTVGKSAYGYRALGDLMVFLFFGLLSVLGSFFLMAKTLDLSLLLPAASIGLLSVSVLNLNNMRDMTSDLKSRKYTLAGLMGDTYSKVYHFFLIILALVFIIIFQFNLGFSSYTIMLSWGAFIPFLLHLKSVYSIRNPKQYDPHLKRVALSTFTLSIFLSLWLILENFYSHSII